MFEDLVQVIQRNVIQLGGIAVPEEEIVENDSSEENDISKIVNVPVENQVLYASLLTTAGGSSLFCFATIGDRIYKLISALEAKCQMKRK
jgi:hypothetical protein